MLYLLKFGFGKKSLLYGWTSDQLNTFSLNLGYLYTVRYLPEVTIYKIHILEVLRGQRIKLIHTDLFAYFLFFIFIPSWLLPIQVTKFKKYKSWHPKAW